MKTVLIGSLVAGSGGALYGYITKDNGLSKPVVNPRPKPTNQAYKDCIQGKGNIKAKSESVCGWLYRGLKGVKNR